MNRLPFRARARRRCDVRAAIGLALALAAGGCGIFGGSGKDPRGVLAADADVRRDAVVALGETRDPAAVPVLADRLLKDPDNLVRATAARALGRVRDRSTGPYLVAALKDAHEMVRWEACVALGDVQDPATIPDLVRVLDSDECADCRREAAKSLGALLAKDALESLIAALSDRDEGVRKAAWDALKGITGQPFPRERAPWEVWFRNLPATPPPAARAPTPAAAAPAAPPSPAPKPTAPPAK
ncbi:MAG: HEAT repeat domain-containing protein [Planctomycetes bacterium]|nr:HEAT repeat domain-containing protein [Planctomycetota bacterium]